ncbi:MULTISPECIES: FAD-dependent oxidoreductase [unclassified Devosia]|uniref:NAD(P)/FAD-dependent oxidoreductase n=1 Tax=unclassified Devosia TaxID=196773 RepID=UPI00086F66A6|nr:MULTISPECIES: FAD-dependent oxidoreductase [unclassified Devosia]MBN9362655.1 FAD-binding oxidoreductase [Devosia sp.]ODS81810.1 MAG: hypothetical protein ABS47_23700 [Devosia sp. SCN 66-27]OJX23841.1 MAG: hypothetical protein BGO83_03000 [Devosia sp. 66-14]
MTVKRIAVLGAGILGSCLALLLARRGHDVTVFDKESEPVACASRWNEGKIHLGYLYGADDSLRTARHILPGSLSFGRVLSELLGADLRPHTTSGDDIYLVHRNSVVDPVTLERTFSRIDELLREHPLAREYLVDVSAARTRRLSPSECREISGADEVVAALEVPERSINTQWVADSLAAALRSQARVTLRLETMVTDAKPAADPYGRWHVVAGDGTCEPFDVVVNALWEGRLAVDLTAGITPAPGWSHRFRYCLFMRTTRPVALRSALITVGGFGDVKNYNGRDFYMSWYPVGMVRQGGGITLERPEPLDAAATAQFVGAVRAQLGSLLPGIDAVFEAAEDIKVRGGFVFAQAKGSVDDPAASIHRRDRFGVQREGNYYSVDTGKYSTAPWMAEQLAAEISGD